MFFSSKKTHLWSKMFTPKKVSGVEIWNVGDRLKRVFPKFQPNRSYPRGVNGRSKFSNKSQNFDVLGVENLNVGDALKRVFPKFGADRSHPRGVNVRSKFRTNSSANRPHGTLDPSPITPPGGPTEQYTPPPRNIRGPTFNQGSRVAGEWIARKWLRSHLRQFFQP